ncbi:hypothetical protein QBC34DRAFT_383456 [Podospora aff. communis PSN243]|uniref:Secreted protein n=1 Tax=Podospora aff. communis PSN243 TaxID=3040156 RepID=A0AAV9GDY5_9PEZI|nr:hypothetical protein QBC34DRAFT_383456 [Podospora aff. communis PSN243]
MRLAILGPMGALVSGAVADTFTTYTTCPARGGNCDSSKSVWWNVWGQARPFNANAHCRDPFIPGVTEVCMDWGSNSAFFRTTTGQKRCLRKESSRSVTRCAAVNVCYFDTWVEIACL